MHRADGRVEVIGAHQQGFRFGPGDRFVFRCGSGGGWGDPLDRDPSAVEADLRLGRLDQQVASEIYGVVPGDSEATATLRGELLERRLAVARPASHPLSWEDVPESYHDERNVAPLHPGVEQRGGVAVSTRSGAPLALAPGHWTDGCPTVSGLIAMADGVEARGYLDPQSGHLLFVDLLAGGMTRSFESNPDRWTKWSPNRVSAPRAN
jgi:N-methylhydantoinase B